MAYRCERCEDSGYIAGDPNETMSWREVERRKMLSRSMKVWAEHMPKAECPVCKGDSSSLPPLPKEEAPVVNAPADPPKKKRGRPRKVWL